MIYEYSKSIQDVYVLGHNGHNHGFGNVDNAAMIVMVQTMQDTSKDNYAAC
jgi:hypothetical protein